NLFSRQHVLVVAQPSQERVRRARARPEGRTARGIPRDLGDLRDRIARQNLVDPRAELVDNTDDEVDRLSREPTNLVPRPADKVLGLAKRSADRVNALFDCVERGPNNARPGAGNRGLDAVPRRPNNTAPQPLENWAEHIGNERP